jgi:Transposase
VEKHVPGQFTRAGHLSRPTLLQALPIKTAKARQLLRQPFRLASDTFRFMPVQSFYGRHALAPSPVPLIFADFYRFPWRRKKIEKIGRSRAKQLELMGWTQPSVSNPASVGQGGLNDHHEEAREGPKMDIRTLGIDLAKNLFRVHGVDAHGRTVVERELRRRQLLPFVAQLRPCLVGMEACGGAHYWAREIAKRGHEVRLMSPRFVRPYVKSNKNDARDAEAICEAVGRPSMRFVAVKSVAQQDMLALHRVRSLLIRERTALMNQMRGLLAEFGIVVAQGPARLRRALAVIQEERDDGLSELLHEMLVEMGERLRWLEQRLKRDTFRSHPTALPNSRA